MKRILITLSLAIAASIYSWGQAPQKMSYQSIIRNAQGNLVTSSTVSLRISILQTSANGSSVYTETHNGTTNVNGLLSIEIGNGNTSDDFSSIDWSDGPYFVMTETDPNGGINYSITGTSQLLSVPYALYAETSGSSTPGPKGDKGDAGDQGIQGLTGEKGDKGDAGDQGIQGLTGEKGDKGDAGDQGIQGLTGEKGDKGDAGDQGIQGLTGEKGDKGDAGDQGIQGLTGEKGDKGDAGDQGIQGLTGEKGDKGDAGDQGIQGLTGEKGDKGDAGDAGQNGTDGNTLLNGTSDPLSITGVDGDFYINSSSNKIFGPKTGGAWGAGTSLSANGGNLAQLDVDINGTVVTDPPSNHLLLGVSSSSKTLLTEEGYLYEISGNALYKAFPIYTNGTCAGTPAYVYYSPSENGGEVAPGLVFGNGSNTYYIPSNATLTTITYNSYNDLATGACQTFTETSSAYPMLPNDAGVTGYSLGADNLVITLTSK